MISWIAASARFSLTPGSTSGTRLSLTFPAEIRARSPGCTSLPWLAVPVEYASDTCWTERRPSCCSVRPEDLAGLRVTELATLAVEGKLDAGDQAVLTAEPERDRAVLDLDHLTVDLREQRLNLIDEHTEGGRRGLGSRRPGTPESDEEHRGRRYEPRTGSCGY